MALWLGSAFTAVVGYLSAISAGGTEQASFSVMQALQGRGVALPDDALASARSNASTTSQRCSVACKIWSDKYGEDQVDAAGGQSYADFKAKLWSAQQGDVSPACILRPANAEEVSSIVLISRLTQCPFAAKSGGHAAFAGASNIQDGITISFQDMKDIDVSEDKTRVRVQPGLTWSGVYSALEEHEITVIGGRVDDIGVGGLTLGGGISFFSNLRGWACDNVLSYTVVLADGQIVTASPTQRPDLYRALRGGGNNLGLVVEFEQEAYPLPGNKLWGGTRVYLADQANSVISAFTGFSNRVKADRNASNWVIFTQQGGVNLAAAELVYIDPYGGGQNASILGDYYAGDLATPISDSTQTRSLVNYTYATQGGAGYYLRQGYYVTSVMLDEDVLKATKDYYFSKTAGIQDVPGVFSVHVFQAITVPQIEEMQKRGGNVLGLKPEDGPRVLVQVSVWWNEAKDDERVKDFALDIEDNLQRIATEKGKKSGYIYMNYASKEQDVIASYGDDQKSFLQKVSKRYDPQQVFQKLQPGYFKLDGAPVPRA